MTRQEYLTGLSSLIVRNATAMTVAEFAGVDATELGFTPPSKLDISPEAVQVHIDETLKGYGEDVYEAASEFGARIAEALEALPQEVAP